jgi:hypothetical protein
MNWLVMSALIGVLVWLVVLYGEPEEDCARWHYETRQTGSADLRVPSVVLDRVCD